MAYNITEKETADTIYFLMKVYNSIQERLKKKNSNLNLFSQFIGNNRGQKNSLNIIKGILAAGLDFRKFTGAKKLISSRKCEGQTVN